MKRLVLFVSLVLLSILLSGCYNKTIDSSSSGVKTSSGKVEEIVSAGWYFNMNPMAGMNVIDHSAKTFSWYDPDLVTQDKQPIGISMSITVQRSTKNEDVKEMWNTYRSEATSDSALEQQVLGRVPGVAKAITTKYTLDENRQHQHQCHKVYHILFHCIVFLYWYKIQADAPNINEPSNQKPKPNR